MKKTFLFLSLIFLTIFGFSQITTTVNPSIAQMQQVLQGNGVTISGLTVTCPIDAYALFGNGSSALGGLNSGILLTTGQATNVAGPPLNNTSIDNTSSGGAGSALGNTLSGGTTYDGCYINFLITPNCSTLSISYVFASEEYPEFASGTINDVFGFVLSGPNPAGGSFNQTNIALVPGTTTPVSIQNVNNGISNTGPCTNCAYYIADPPGLIYDGCTTVLTASTSVIPCQTYTMTIGVWDDSDEIYDSGVFLDVNGLSCVGNPTITAVTTPSALCGPQTITLTAGGGIASGTYTWVAPASGGLVSTNGPTVTANPTASTTYTVLYSDVNTCPGVPLVQTTTVTFTGTPTFPISQSPAGSICAGQSVTLTASGGAGTYTWSPATTPATGSVVVVTPGVTTTYTVTKTSGSCSSNTVITVNVGTPPTVSITPNNASICPGQTLSLAAQGGSGTYTWTASSGSNPPNTATVTVNPSSNTTYTVLTGSGTCTSSATASVTINALPSVTIAPASSSICAGQSVTLTANGGSTYTWTASAGTNPPNAATVIVTPTTSTSYTVLTGSGTCTASTTASINVTPANIVSVTPTSSSICAGQSVTLTASGGTSYTWTASSGTTPASTAVVVVSPTSNTSYTVSTGSGSCVTTATTDVFVTPVNTVTVSPLTSNVCAGQSVTLTATGGSTYTWTASSGTTPPATGTVVVTPATTTTYTVVTGAGSCTTSAASTVSVTSTPTISLSPASSTICSGQSLTLTTTGGSTYTWTASSGANPPGTGTVIVTPTVSTTYTVVSGAGSCTSSAVSSVSVAPAITLTVTPLTATICGGSTGTVLTASGAPNYTWTPSTGLSSVNAGTVTANPATSQVYTVTGGNGVCTSTASVNVNVITVAATVTASSTYYCPGVSPVNITAGGATNYTWSPASGLSSTSGANVTASPTITTLYTFTASTGSCTATNSVNINVPSTVSLSIVPSSTLICNGGTSTLTANGASTYTWLPTLTTNSVLTVTLSNSTTYTVAGQTSTGCLAVPAIVTISVSPLMNPLIVPASNTVCLTNTLSVNSTATGTGLSYTWQPTSVISGANNTQSIVVQPTTTATIIFTLTTSNGVCTESITASVQPVTCIPPTSSFVTLTNDTICTKGCVTFSATSTGSQPRSFLWSFPGGTPATSNLINPTICYNTKGDYTVSLITTNPYGTDTIIKPDYINVADTPAVVIAMGDTLINIGQTAPISVSGGLTYSWYPNNGSIACSTCSNTIVQPTVTTQYIATAYNSPYCKKQDTILVRVDFICGDFFVPNAFSPNDDGLNDFVKVHGFCISTFNMQIFNRWGEKVFETTSKEDGWDGKFRGKPMDTGVFIYKVDGITIDGKSFTMKGNITLIR